MRIPITYYDPLAEDLIVAASAISATLFQHARFCPSDVRVRRRDGLGLQQCKRLCSAQPERTWLSVA
ncbi:MAG: hypothetical protein NZ699_12115 [Roseiflexus sp.]|nr:hypothetical protein [Roseiflexus sp.]MCS7289867.1 hypothetical protein [Roseiflexus sp.]MDW8145145.1 hypothetical protein [Roseiflexaceae bacterium]MDW8231801.1 hypothetical protein [Roseiflexaceae bacterium]